MTVYDDELEVDFQRSFAVLGTGLVSFYFAAKEIPVYEFVQSYFSNNYLAFSNMDAPYSGLLLTSFLLFASGGYMAAKASDKLKSKEFALDTIDDIFL